MLRLGTRVRLNGQDALIVARTLVGTPSYDVRLTDGRIVKYAAESDLDVPGIAGSQEGPAHAGVGGQP
ncbi:hypothetical protein [Azospirillum sp. ST 5-10]|uniref:hypothetical protein n=1 Tax=unclassified Azospirillum TaxID=2630922 RepID=UPI003F49C24D